MTLTSMIHGTSDDGARKERFYKTGIELELAAMTKPGYALGILVVCR